DRTRTSRIQRLHGRAHRGVRRPVTGPGRAHGAPVRRPTDRPPASGEPGRPPAHPRRHRGGPEPAHGLADRERHLRLGAGPCRLRRSGHHLRRGPVAAAGDRARWRGPVPARRPHVAADAVAPLLRAAGPAGQPGGHGRRPRAVRGRRLGPGVLRTRVLLRDRRRRPGPARQHQGPGLGQEVPAL
ncbi:MAG: hypothetical protein AVDCRST_MAG52-2886, partial [uncultured Blastococcus sp.]